MAKVITQAELKKYINQWGTFLNIKVHKLTEEQAEWGKVYARLIAPVDTNALINAIDVTKADKNSKYAVVSRVPNNPDGRQRPYHLYMHGLGGKDTRTQKFHGRTPDYMDKTAEWLDERYFNRVNKAVNEQLKK